jgi:hypothetical protein
MVFPATILPTLLASEAIAKRPRASSLANRVFWKRGCSMPAAHCAFLPARLGWRLLLGGLIRGRSLVIRQTNRGPLLEEKAQAHCSWGRISRKLEPYHLILRHALKDINVRRMPGCRYIMGGPQSSHILRLISGPKTGFRSR